ncbi:MAG: hypothetical protein Q7W16_02975 [Coriobacteriia bacterium]|nr:hypothetical protein [Coriobacteriia bacterium]
MMTPQLLVPIGGAFLFLLFIFQVLTGRRVIHFKGKLHMTVHRWTAYAMIAIAAGHGLFATQTFLGWPF